MAPEQRYGTRTHVWHKSAPPAVCRASRIPQPAQVLSLYSAIKRPDGQNLRIILISVLRINSIQKSLTLSKIGRGSVFEVLTLITIMVMPVMMEMVVAMIIIMMMMM